jgi:hypothetical protein
MKDGKYEPGDLVYTKRSALESPPRELYTVLWELDPDDDEEDIKYLTRTGTHMKRTFFHCELTPAVENSKKPAG